MLTFEKEPFQGTQNILQKLTVSNLDRQPARSNGPSKADKGVEPAVSKGPASSRHHGRATLERLWRHYRDGHWSADGMWISRLKELQSSLHGACQDWR